MTVAAFFTRVLALLLAVLTPGTATFAVLSTGIRRGIGRCLPAGSPCARWTAWPAAR